MTTPEEDLTRRRIVLDAATEHEDRRQRRLLRAVGVTLTIMLLITSLQFYTVNRAVTATIPALKKTISDQTFVIGKAIDAIVAECTTIRTLGGKCPIVILKAPEPKK